jgi:hypothetical protein
MDETKAEKPRDYIGWMAANAVAVLTLVAAGFYTELRLVHQTFYGPLGLTPEDVGLDYGAALARATGLAFYILITFVIVFGPIVWFKKLSKTELPVVILLGLALVFFLVWLQARRGSEDVRGGERVRHIFFTDDGTHAERAHYHLARQGA